MHQLALQAAKSAADTLGTEFNRRALDTLEPITYLTAIAVAAAMILAFTGRGQPPGYMAGAGLLLLLLHAAGRGATFVGMFTGPFAGHGLRPILQIAEVTGLALLAVAAVRYRPARAPGARTASLTPA